MAGAVVSLELEGGDEAFDALEAVIARLDNPKPLYDAIGSALVQSTDQRFQNEEDPDGNPWPKSVRAQNDGGKTLTDTGELVRSITYEATSSGVAIGTNLIKAGPHQFGATIKAKDGGVLAFSIGGVSIFATSVKIPARPFLGVSDEDEATIIDLSAEFALGPVGAKQSEDANG